jgi:hypothetical protein
MVPRSGVRCNDPMLIVAEVPMDAGDGTGPANTHSVVLVTDLDELIVDSGQTHVVPSLVSTSIRRSRYRLSRS